MQPQARGRSGLLKIATPVAHTQAVLGRTTSDTRWLNNVVGALTGEIRPCGYDSGFEVVLNVAEPVWEPLA